MTFLKPLTVIVLLMLISACNQESTKTEQELPKDKPSENLITTKDGNITFNIVNSGGFPDKTLEKIKDELVAAYDVINTSIATDYVPSERINVYLMEGNEISSGYRERLNLYSIKEDKYPLVHELTHTLLGYGDNNGFLTQEGYADYMENKYGKQKMDFHRVMRHFIDSNKKIPLTNLMDPETDNTYFRPLLNFSENYTLMWMAYIQAASFVSYLIESYGMDDFENIYNKPDLPSLVEKVYRKNVAELENEWVDYLLETQPELTYNDKLKINHFYEAEANMKLLDEDLFKEK
ncbi:hypothetical protein [Bacillus sp. FJAT-27445]|uniref:hypothetical protein n=1 Tax=Bacillus sp. FJAT-27445 TaxID=1679166 RepID=UPI000743EB10|nr:hypothetical protein [Bacillus sp. FJAT-27445]